LAWSPRQAETHQQHGAANAQPLQRISTARHRHAATAFEADAGRVAEQQVPAVRASKTLGSDLVDRNKKLKKNEKRRRKAEGVPYHARPLHAADSSLVSCRTK
jgi:hypothetical protein